mgnify:CR=1 FL=1
MTPKRVFRTIIDVTGVGGKRVSYIVVTLSARSGKSDNLFVFLRDVLSTPNWQAIQCLLPKMRRMLSFDVEYMSRRLVGVRVSCHVTKTLFQGMAYDSVTIVRVLPAKKKQVISKSC